MGVQRFTDLRAWQACHVYKNAVYRLCATGPLSRDWPRRRQLEAAVAGPPAHIAEGFGRFNPADFARFLVLARASLMESQNHLRDALDKGYIAALRNARRARERRIASRPERRTPNPEPEPEPRTEPEHEPRTKKREV